jgi:hypothetical protein
VSVLGPSAILADVEVLICQISGFHCLSLLGLYPSQLKFSLKGCSIAPQGDDDQLRLVSKYVSKYN